MWICTLFFFLNQTLTGGQINFLKASWWHSTLKHWSALKLRSKRGSVYVIVTEICQQTPLKFIDVIWCVQSRLIQSTLNNQRDIQAKNPVIWDSALPNYKSHQTEVLIKRTNEKYRGASGKKNEGQSDKTGHSPQENSVIRSSATPAESSSSCLKSETYAARPLELINVNIKVCLCRRVWKNSRAAWFHPRWWRLGTPSAPGQSGPLALTAGTWRCFQTECLEVAG